MPSSGQYPLNRLSIDRVHYKAHFTTRPVRRNLSVCRTYENRKPSRHVKQGNPCENISKQSFSVVEKKILYFTTISILLNTSEDTSAEKYALKRQQNAQMNSKFKPQIVFIDVYLPIFNPWLKKCQVSQLIEKQFFYF